MRHMGLGGGRGDLHPAFFKYQGAEPISMCPDLGGNTHMSNPVFDYHQRVVLCLGEGIRAGDRELEQVDSSLNRGGFLRGQCHMGKAPI